MRLTAVAATTRPADLEVSAEGHAEAATVERIAALLLDRGGHGRPAPDDLRIGDWR